jgi:hypothetical protein
MIETLINIVDCEVKSATDDATSSVKSATLRLIGWLASIQLRPEPQKEWSVFFNGNWWTNDPTVYISLDCKLPTLRLHCLPLFVDTHQLPHWNVSCLLLGPTGISKGQFSRFGVLHVFAGAFGMEDWTSFRDAQNEGWLEYETLDDNGQYTISIV